VPKSVATLAILFIATTTCFTLCATTTAQQLHHTPVAVRALASCFALWCVLRRLRLAAIAVAGTVCWHCGSCSLAIAGGKRVVDAVKRELAL